MKKIIILTMCMAFMMLCGVIQAAAPTPGQNFRAGGLIQCQWHKNGVAISGATGTSYTIPNVGDGDAGMYIVIVSGTGGSTMSDAATLTVEEPVLFNYHPADSNQDQLIKIAEVTTYGKAWKNGGEWSVAPIPIPIAYLTVAGKLWKNGENYTLDTGKEAPLCWVSSTVSQASVQSEEMIMAAAASSASSAINGDTVTITVTPESGTFCYAVEDQIPEGITVSGINESGVFDKVNNKVKWGPWFDDTPRTLTYTLVSGTFTGTATLSGIASFDGVDVTIDGDRNYTVGGGDTPSTDERALCTISGNTVTLTITPESGTFCYAVEDQIPSGMTVTGINESGVFDKANNKVKWGPYFDDKARTLTYTLVPGTFTGTATLSGVASFDGVDVAITGDRKYTPIVVTKPAITTQPKSQTVNEGKSVTFSVVATGTGLSYQWKKAGTSISGATSASYNIASVKASDAGDYTVTVSNTAGSVTSSAATLTVTAKPTITTQPKSQTASEGQSVTFTVVASGSNLKYQWNKNDKAISGATSANYTIAKVDSSDKGNYSVTVSNIAGSVTSSIATLTVIETPEGNAVRSIKINGQTATVTLTLKPSSSVSAYFVEEKVPSIGTVTPKDGGVYTASKGVIRWSFLDNNSREISYTVTVDEDYAEVATVSGKVTFDTTDQVITGDTELDFTVKTHPADMNDDFEISTPEVSSYVVAWKQDKAWSRDPVEIPMAYAAKAAVIWVNGGDYTYDASKTKPACWVYVTDASLLAASANTAERTVKTADGKAEVSIAIEPAEETGVYFVEEKLSAEGALTVSNISDGGNYIADKNLIRWSFLDNAPRTLTYTVEPDDGFSGNIALTGEVMFNEETIAIEGDSEISFGSEITYELEDGAMVLTFTGTLESSEDGIHWTALDAVSPYRVTITEGKKFFRSVK